LKPGPYHRLDGGVRFDRDRRERAAISRRAWIVAGVGLALVGLLPALALLTLAGLPPAFAALFLAIPAAVGVWALWRRRTGPLSRRAKRSIGAALLFTFVIPIIPGLLLWVYAGLLPRD
jgi:hypothetical protein